MNGQVKVKIDGQELMVAKGTTIIEAAKSLGIEIPHFCYHPRLKVAANCRVCLVEVEKMPKLQTSCSTTVSDGMVVHTDTPNVIEARRSVMEFILSNHPLDCPICDKGGECHLQDEAMGLTKASARFGEVRRTFDKEYFSPLVEKEMNRCIACLRCARYCDEVMEVGALGAIDRGTHTQVGAFMHNPLSCEFCGGCIQICPVGALTNRLSMFEYRPWQIKKTDTICTYCGDGCMLTLEVKDDKVVRVTSQWGAGRNRGSLCVKGYFGYQFVDNPKRLARPMVKRGKKLIEVNWDEALGYAAKRIKEIKEKHGGKAIGGLISTRCTNEDIYIFQKFMRTALKSNNIDSQARYGYINLVKGIRSVFGSKKVVASYEDIRTAKVILIIGADVTESNPIVGLNIKEAVNMHGAMLVNIDPLTSKIAKNACRHIKVRPGSEGEVIKGIIKAIVDSSLYDKGLESRPVYLDRIKAAVSRIDYKDIAEKSFAGEDEIRGVAELFAKGERVVIIAGPRLGYLAEGYNNVLNLADLLVLTGLADRKGSGILPLALGNNESGALMMGASPEYLPGYNDCRDKNIRSLFSKAWKEDIPNDYGLTLMEMIEKAASGELKALYLIGEDPIEDLPDRARVKDAIGKLEFVIYQGIFPSEIMEQADLILPASSFAEKDGYFTNLEGVVQRVRGAIDPRGESLPDWEIISLLSEKMGYPLSYGSSDEIHKEIDNILGSINDDKNRLDLYMNSRPHGSESRWDVRIKDIDSGYPYTLLFGETLFHSGRLSTFDIGLKGIYPGGGLLIGTDDAKRLGLADGDKVMVRSKHSECRLGVKIDQRFPEGFVLFPWSFRNSSVVGLTDLQVDPDTKTPYFKMASVSIERI